jgi:hypothetical protein
MPYYEDIIREMLEMAVKHTIHLRLPRLNIFGKKKTNVDGTEVVTEVDLEEKEKDISTALLVGVPLVIGVSVGYLVGFKAGVNKGGTNIMIMKD